jgi:hypothetical protein
MSTKDHKEYVYRVLRVRARADALIARKTGPVIGHQTFSVPTPRARAPGAQIFAMAADRPKSLRLKGIEPSPYRLEVY